MKARVPDEWVDNTCDKVLVIGEVTKNELPIDAKLGSVSTDTDREEVKSIVVAADAGSRVVVGSKSCKSEVEEDS